MTDDFAKSFGATVEAFDGLPISSQVDYYRARVKRDADRIAALEAEVAALVHDLERLKDSETHHLNRADKAEAEVARLRSALEIVKQDCLGRMPLSHDGKTVPIGAGAWMKLCAALGDASAQQDSAALNTGDATP